MLRKGLFLIGSVVIVNKASEIITEKKRKLRNFIASKLILRNFLTGTITYVSFLSCRCHIATNIDESELHKEQRKTSTQLSLLIVAPFELQQSRKRLITREQCTIEISFNTVNYSFRFSNKLISDTYFQEKKKSKSMILLRF